MLYKPTWSKAKKRLNSLVCPALRQRVDFHVINYRGAHDELGRAVITVDKVERLSMCTITAERALYYKKNELRSAASDFYFDDVTKNVAIADEAHQLLKTEGLYAQYDFFSTLEVYLNASIKESLNCSDTLMKILCLVDRRVGKRTLQNMREQIIHEPELVQYFYHLRCKVENRKTCTL